MSVSQPFRDCDAAGAARSGSRLNDQPRLPRAISACVPAGLRARPRSQRPVASADSRARPIVLRPSVSSMPAPSASRHTFEKLTPSSRATSEACRTSDNRATIRASFSGGIRDTARHPPFIDIVSCVSQVITRSRQVYSRAKPPATPARIDCPLWYLSWRTLRAFRSDFAALFVNMTLCDIDARAGTRKDTRCRHGGRAMTDKAAFFMWSSRLGCRPLFASFCIGASFFGSRENSSSGKMLQCKVTRASPRASNVWKSISLQKEGSHETHLCCRPLPLACRNRHRRPGGAPAAIVHLTRSQGRYTRLD